MRASLEPRNLNVAGDLLQLAPAEFQLIHGAALKMANVANPHFVRMTALLGCNGLLFHCERAISVNSSTSGLKQTKCLLVVNSLIPSVLGSIHAERGRQQMLPRSVSHIQR